MTAPLICSFDSLEAAQLAREEVLAEGLPEESVLLRVTGDEAGPVEGNFVSGNGRPEGETSREDAVPGGAIAYDCNFARTVSRGVCLLVAQAADEAQRRHVVALLDQLGARLTPA